MRYLFIGTTETVVPTILTDHGTLVVIPGDVVEIDSLELHQFELVDDDYEPDPVIDDVGDPQERTVIAARHVVAEPVAQLVVPPLEQPADEDPPPATPPESPKPARGGRRGATTSPKGE